MIRTIYLGWALSLWTYLCVNCLWIAWHSTYPYHMLWTAAGLYFGDQAFGRLDDLLEELR